MDTINENSAELGFDRDIEISRTKRAALLPKVIKYLFRAIKKGVPKLKSLKKVNPRAPRRRRPRRPRRGPTRPGRPLPEPEEPNINQPPLPYPGIPRRTPARRPVPGPLRPVFKEAA